MVKKKGGYWSRLTCLKEGKKYDNDKGVRGMRGKSEKYTRVCGCKKAGDGGRLAWQG